MRRISVKEYVTLIRRRRWRRTAALDLCFKRRRLIDAHPVLATVLKRLLCDKLYRLIKTFLHL